MSEEFDPPSEPPPLPAEISAALGRRAMAPNDAAYTAPDPTNTPAADKNDQGEAPVTFAEAEAIYRRFERPLFGYIYHLVGNTELASDLNHDTFVKAFAALQSAPIRRVALSSWLHRIATHTALDALRKGKHDYTHVEWVSLSQADDQGVELGATLPASDDVEQLVLDRGILADLLNELPESYANILILKIVYGYTNDEVAKMLHRTPDAIRVMAGRAKVRARKIIAAQDAGQPIDQTIENEDPNNNE